MICDKVYTVYTFRKIYKYNFIIIIEKCKRIKKEYRKLIILIDLNFF